MVVGIGGGIAEFVDSDGTAASAVVARVPAAVVGVMWNGSHLTFSFILGQSIFKCFSENHK